MVRQVHFQNSKDKSNHWEVQLEETMRVIPGGSADEEGVLTHRRNKWQTKVNTGYIKNVL
jgi:hypothetical protein